MPNPTADEIKQTLTDATENLTLAIKALKFGSQPYDEIADEINRVIRELEWVEANLWRTVEEKHS